MTQAIAMIETRAALDALDDILRVEGLDGVFVGPSDLSIALSDGRGVEPRGEAVLAKRGGSPSAPRRMENTRPCSASTAPMFERCRPGLSAMHHLERPDAAARGGAEQTRGRPVRIDPRKRRPRLEKSLRTPIYRMGARACSL